MEQDNYPYVDRRSGKIRLILQQQESMIREQESFALDMSNITQQISRLERMKEITNPALSFSYGGHSSIVNDLDSLNQSSLVDIRRNLLDLKEDRDMVFERSKLLAEKNYDYIKTVEENELSPYYRSKYQQE